MEPKKIKKIFVDSDAFVALAKADDANHLKAQEILNQLIDKQVAFLTSNYVFAETVTVISQRVGHKAAIVFIQQIKTAEPLFSIHYVDQEIEDLAIDLFKVQHSKNVSFVDCANIALIKHDRLDAIFSFDRIYKKNGLVMAGDLMLSKKR